MEMSSKIVNALGRISEVFKVLLWEYAKRLKLSPIQIQILNFIETHQASLCTVSAIAQEFNVTKPTISDAIRVLEKKEMIIKTTDAEDSRSYTIALSELGRQIVSETQGFTAPIHEALTEMEEDTLAGLYETLSTLIYQWNRKGILSVQRMCFGCSFYEKKNSASYCNLLQKNLHTSDLQIDCPEYVEKS